MACEKWVIVTLVGGITDIVENEKNGMLIHIYNANDPAVQLCELLNNTREVPQA